MLEAHRLPAVHGLPKRLQEIFRNVWMINNEPYWLYAASAVDAMTDPDSGDVVAQMPDGTYGMFVPDSELLRLCYAVLNQQQQLVMSPAYVVVQQGGSSIEWYPTMYDTLQEAEEAIARNAKSTYDSLGPFEIAQPATDADWLEVMQEAMRHAALGQFAIPDMSLVSDKDDDSEDEGEDA